MFAGQKPLIGAPCPLFKEDFLALSHDAHRHTDHVWVHRSGKRLHKVVEEDSLAGCLPDMQTAGGQREECK